MAEIDDWRRMGQERYLTGARFRFQAYVVARRDWDHDHCEFCTYVEFAEPPMANALYEGWATPYNGILVSFRWVCEQCFADFRDEFGFQVVDSW